MSCEGDEKTDFQCFPKFPIFGKGKILMARRQNDLLGLSADAKKL
jgi:hypothetical protein